MYLQDIYHRAYIGKCIFHDIYSNYMNNINQTLNNNIY